MAHVCGGPGGFRGKEGKELHGVSFRGACNTVAAVLATRLKAAADMSLSASSSQPVQTRATKPLPYTQKRYVAISMMLPVSVAHRSGVSCRTSMNGCRPSRLLLQGLEGLQPFTLVLDDTPERWPICRVSACSCLG